MSRTGGGRVSEADGDVEGATIRDVSEGGAWGERGGLETALAMVAVVVGIGAATAAGRAGGVALDMVLASVDVTGGTIVSGGRPGSVATMAMTSSGLRPSKSAFWISSAAMNSFRSAVLCVDSARVPTLSL